MGKISFFERTLLYLPHSVSYSLYKLLKKKRFKQRQEDRKLIVKGKEKYSLKGFDDNKCLFVHIPKAGGVSVAMSLFGNLGYGHKPIYKYLHIYTKKEFKEYFKFTFVRNPWDRLVSAYFFLKSGGFHEEDAQWFKEHLSEFENFEDFVTNWVNLKNIYSWIHFIPQHEFISINSRVVVDKIYKIEEVGDGICDINLRLNTKIVITHENRTSNRKRDYKSYYNENTKKIVNELYKKDIELFQYEF